MMNNKVGCGNEIITSGRLLCRLELRVCTTSVWRSLSFVLSGNLLLRKPGRFNDRKPAFQRTPIS